MELNSLIPICFIILFGTVLKTTHFINNAFVKKTIDLMHFVLLPIVIFWTIAGSENSVVFGWDACFSALFSTFLFFLISLLYIYFFKIERAKAHVFSMSCYRPNVYLGLTLIYYLFDSNVFSKFCIVLFMVIPLADVMTGIGRIWILKEKKRAEIVLPLIKSIFSNPVVIAGVLGILFSKINFHPPVFLTNFFDFVYPAIFPLSLILTGAMLSQVRIKNFPIVVVAASFLKTIILPSSACLLFYVFWPESEMFCPMIIFLSLPYMLDRKISSTTDSIQKELMMPYYSMSALFFFTGIMVLYCYLQYKT